MKNNRVQAAEALLSDFAKRTGISETGRSKDRYLWTDAFAVCGFLGLYLVTRQQTYLDWALRLVDQVHHTLGQHREDDPRTGWISGLSKHEGERHPTCSGLRIGKRLNERSPDEPFDDQLEWDRDGQYFHYLTKWMHALNRVSLVIGEPRYNDWALELAQAACCAFVYEPTTGGPSRMYWKMRIDLSGPLVPSMGQSDPLDGFVACSRLLAARGDSGQPQAPDLSQPRSEMRRMCEGATWATADELGIGGLLTEAGQLVQLVAEGQLDHPPVLDDVLADTQRSLQHFETYNHLGHPAEVRLAFRELGLSIGLQALTSMRDCIFQRPERFNRSEDLLVRVESLARYSPLIERIERFWTDPASQRSATWTEHLDINTVMLATSLVPQVYLMSDPGLFAGSEKPKPRRTQ